MTRSPPSARARRGGSRATAPSQTTAPRSELSGLAVRWTGPRGEALVTALAGGTLRIGRDPDNEVVLDGDETSRRHAEIEQRGPALVVRDKGSRNGVHCDGVRIEERPLAEGTVLRLGDWVGVIVGGSGDLAEVAPGLWGGSSLERAVSVIRRAAPSSLNLVLLGETGTGKEVVARAIHQWSGRPGAFVAVNCAAMPEALAEAELFGHERGAFTGAIRARSGHVREANGGVLFLDEVGELPFPVQAKLLRVLQEREITPVGTSERIPVDLRVVSATHRDLPGMVRAGTFREDLLNRVEGAAFELPPLRARRGDVYPLFRRFAEAALGRPLPRVSPRFLEALLIHRWPGNVRELKQTAERLSVLRGGTDEWHLRDLALLGRRSSAAPASPAPTSPIVVIESPRSTERRRMKLQHDEILRALVEAGGVVVEAARRLGVSKQTLYNAARECSIDLNAFRVREPPRR